MFSVTFILSTGAYATLILLASRWGARALLYPTQPTADTVFQAGQSTALSWIDEGSHPSLEEMGKLRIDLYVGNDTFVKNLANNVDPQKQSHNVTISPSLGPDGSNYYILFSSNNPLTSIYTARFAITEMTNSTNSSTNSSTNFSSASNSITSSVDTSTNTAEFTTITLVLPSTTGPSQLPDSASSATLESTAAVSSSSGLSKPQSNDAGSRRRLSLEKAQFRLVFVLWPALIGVALAL